MLKADLRRQMLARRRALPAGELARRSLLLGKQLFQAFEVARWRWLHVYLPVARQREPDTWPIIHQLWREHPNVQVAVPVVQLDGVHLRHYHLTPDTLLVENRWHIPEPIGASEVALDAFDAVLLPLLAFDELGHRVGYGKGFYDRFLLECRPDVLRIGLSLEPPIERIADAWIGDVPLHACITPERVWRFQ
ncbi:5-formyltetrahydrofolate cyclo-ligase [Hymenobacter crusticola]|uniref:5-formyltetrahydrofolate cyclo-ligase n=1 Tax=Hymenobacter crusticola TaxID=1770526 RepID=A0A243WJE0_9BACT|nr:5-formyltetrahydrofolate cyclo-ligase [Hymenobacter crusticola]OUJ76012.1 5-formyltetrahydrofolate cyclo-ligase [Hymenobacter crusticola]